MGGLGGWTFAGGSGTVWHNTRVSTECSLAFALAIANEIIWRHFSTDVWVDFKVWGIYPLFFLFALAQTPLILKHEIGEKKD